MAEKKYEQMAGMTFKKMGCDPKAAIKQEKAVFMCRVWGEAVDLKEKEARSGDTYQYLIGSFRAETGDGRTFEAEKLFLPGTLMETIESQLKSAEGKAIEFAYDVYSTPDDSTSIGYRYAAKTVIKPEVSERLAALTEALDKRPIETSAKKSAKSAA